MFQLRWINKNSIVVGWIWLLKTILFCHKQNKHFFASICLYAFNVTMSLHLWLAEENGTSLRLLEIGDLLLLVNKHV